MSLYEELIRKGHSSHSLDEVINFVSIKLGYSEIEFYELIAQIKDPKKLTDFIHPVLHRLKKYDMETGNELYRTLEVYLQCFHNNKETANVLYIHRNSLTYRMDKILEIGKADLNDPMTEFLLKLSFKLAEYLKIKDFDKKEA